MWIRRWTCRRCRICPRRCRPPLGTRGPTIVEQVLGSSAMKSFLRSAASAAGREISRSIFGTGRKRR